MNSSSISISEIQDYEKKGVIFYVNYLVEMFEPPIMREDPNGEEINTALDLIRLSHEDGFNELYISKSETIKGKSEGKDLIFSRYNFLEWQLERFNAKTLYHIASKTETIGSFEMILDYDQEIEKDPHYSPEKWLNENINDIENRKKGYEFIERLRNEKSQEVQNIYKEIIDGITDSSIGVLEWLESETESDDDLKELRHSYSEWHVPIVIVNEGEFAPYIEPEYTENLMMDDFYLNCMFVRNYDEGEKIS